jgi:AAA domain, putative AbiEii toxin, Type IV TA system/AAA ATPase domain
MIREISIKNYKSILDHSIELGRINIFIGENGSGKTNIVEAVATASAAIEDKLGIEELYARGVRIARPATTISSFLRIQPAQASEIGLGIAFGKTKSAASSSLELGLSPEDPDDIHTGWRVEGLRDPSLASPAIRVKFQGHKLGRSISRLYFRDRFMRQKNNVFSAENANEGILHILFYLALFLSDKTPRFFGIDNIETSLNPQLCRDLMKTIARLAKEHDKQALITTHNPAILDGLNLHDDEQRLFVVYRNDQGHTVTKRIKLKPDTGKSKYKLSELWMRGHLGGPAKDVLSHADRHHRGRARRPRRHHQHLEGLARPGPRARAVPAAGVRPR